MALSDDLTGFFSDFAVSATAGGTTGDVILNQPSSIAFDGQVIFTDFGRFWSILGILALFVIFRKKVDFWPF